MGTIREFIQKNRAQLLFLLFSSLFMVVIWFATKMVNFYLFGFPLLVIFFYVSLTNFKSLWLGTVFLMPMSITSSQFFGDQAGVTFPTDFLAIMLLGLLIFKIASERRMLFQFRNHPIPIMIGLQLIWLIFVCIPSEMPVVSWKFFAAYIWMLAAFYFIAVLMFREEKLIYRFLFLIGISFCITFVIIMALFLSTGRSPFGLRFNPGPFFADHTVFGAFAATWIPIWVLLSFKFDLLPKHRKLARLILVGFVVALFFSYSRGAWASAVLGLILMWVFTMPKTYRRFLLPATILFFVIGGYVWYAGQGNTGMKNRAVSRKNLKEHVASITNFRTDDSNAERINRWYCAVEMWKERPLAGQGPGTYAFLYGNYQRASLRTSVSTNRGDNGTAHNEFLLAMSEQGLPGAILLLGLFIAPIWAGTRGYHRAVRKNTKLLYLATTFGLVTYDIHALVNNFMDQDKIGGTYLGFMAIITALDLYILPRERNRAERERVAAAAESPPEEE